MASRGQVVGVVTTAALLFALVACGEDEPAPAPALGPSPTEEAPSAAPTTTSSQSDPTEAFDDKGGELHRGRISADGPVEDAVAEAWLAYWQARLTAYHEVKVDAGALGEVAQGDALQEVIDYVGYLDQNGLHNEGDLKVGISDIEVHGSVAAVEGCMENKGQDVDANGDAAEELHAYVNVIGTLSKVGDTWVVGVKEVTGEKRCRA